MTEIPRYDFHIHTKHLKCANETMEIAAIVETCQALGLTAIGISDHWRGLEQRDLHMLIKKDLEGLTPNIDIYFGAEVNDFISGDWDFTEELMEECGFQYAISGIHDAYIDEYDLKKIVDIQQKHHLKTCQNPLLDVLVHPYWFPRAAWDKRGWPWFDTMKAVPKSYAKELGQVAKETGTAIEINGDAIFDNVNYSEQFCREYMDFLATIAAEGAMFAVGSDAHDISHLKSIEKTWLAAENLGLTVDRIWHPKCQPMVMRDRSRDTKVSSNKSDASDSQ